MAAVKMSPMLRAGWWLHRHLYRLSGGRIGRRINGFEVMLLTTRGRRSGEERHAATTRHIPVVVLEPVAHGRR